VTGVQVQRPATRVVTVSHEQGYWRAKCADKDTCAARTAAGNIGAYWRGGHHSKAADAHADAVKHLVERHGDRGVCASLGCGKPAAGVVQRQGITLLRCAEHHVDLRTAR